MRLPPRSTLFPYTTLFRHIFLYAKSGQVWSAPLLGGRRGRCRLQQGLLSRLRILPAHPSQPLAHGPLADTKPARDLAVGMALSIEPLHASRERHTRPSLRIAAGLAQRGHPAVFKTLFVPAYRASRTVERPRYVVLIGPALLNQIDPRMRLRDAIAHGVVGQHNPCNDVHARVNLVEQRWADQTPRMRLRDAIAHGVVGQHNPGNHHHAPAVLGAQQTSIIDCTRALRATRNRE